MTESNITFLLFTLSGPLAAFGEIAVGERRSLWSAPSKSGVLGLVASCLGIERTEEEKLQILNKGLGYAVRLDQKGYPLRDYHTAQTPTQQSRDQRKKKGLEILTRRDDLYLATDKDDLKTVLSNRYYSVDVRYTIALWQKEKEAWDLHQISEALCEPTFTPFLGRKSCPLGSPMAPRFVTAQSLQKALLTDDAKQVRSKQKRSLDLYFEWDAGLFTEENDTRATGQVHERRDALRKRQNWLFTNRKEGLLQYEQEGETK